MLKPELQDKAIKFVEQLNELVLNFVNEQSDEIAELYQSQYGNLSAPDKMPSISMAIHLLRGAMIQEKVKETKGQTKRSISWAAKGAVNAAKALTKPETPESQARLGVCKGCEEWTGKSCKVCGCFVSLKVRIPEEKCPKGKW
jgi:hypothetical protein